MKYRCENLSVKRIIECFAFLIVITLIILMICSFVNQKELYERWESSSIQYIRGVVVEIIDEHLSPRGKDDEYYVGQQIVVVELIEKKFKGQKIEIENNITAVHNVVLEKDSRVIVCADIPEGIEPYYSIYNYDRSNALLIVVALFISFVIIVGRKKGLMSCIGLIFTLCMIVCYLLPEIYKGRNALLISAITILASTTVTCFCIGGLSRKSFINIINSVLGCSSAALAYWVYSSILSVTGNSLEEVESLVFISQATGLKIKGVLFASIVISSLGAVMDVAVSMGASLNEIHELNPGITKMSIFQSGMNIGKDMIGTMTNTLILAFAGSSLATLIILISYGVEFDQLISSDFIALEVAQGLAGSTAVVLTVPISAAICAIGYGYNKHKLRRKNKCVISKVC